MIPRAAMLRPLVSLLILSLPVAAVAQGTVKTEIVGLAVTLPDPDNEYGGSAVMGRFAGTEVTLRAASPDHFLVAVVDEGDEASDLAIYDASGKALENESSMGIAFRSSISDDGHTVTVPVTSSSVPQPGTTELHIRGKLVLRSATGEKTVDNQFALTAGTEITLGNIPCRIEEIEASSFGEGARMITLNSKQPFDTIAEITFLDPAGNELESDSVGGGNFGFNDQMTYYANYTIEGASDTVTARVRYFESTENLSVEIDMPVTLGIGSEAVRR
jgi:hypothetical protein